MRERNLSNSDFVSEGDLNRHIASVREGTKVDFDLCGSSFTKKRQFEKAHRSSS